MTEQKRKFSEIVAQHGPEAAKCKASKKDEMSKQYSDTKLYKISVQYIRKHIITNMCELIFRK